MVLANSVGIISLVSGIKIKQGDCGYPMERWRNPQCCSTGTWLYLPTELDRVLGVMRAHQRTQSDGVWFTDLLLTFTFSTSVAPQWRGGCLHHSHLLAALCTSEKSRPVLSLMLSNHLPPPTTFQPASSLFFFSPDCILCGKKVFLACHAYLLALLWQCPGSPSQTGWRGSDSLLRVDGRRTWGGAVCGAGGLLLLRSDQEVSDALGSSCVVPQYCWTDS